MCLQHGLCGGDALISKQQFDGWIQLRLRFSFFSFLAPSVKRIVTDISFSNDDSGDQEKI